METIIKNLKNNILVITYNKPARKNAIDVEMYLAVTNILNEASTNEDVLMTVLTGTGDYFSSGNDLSKIANTHAKYDLRLILKNFIDAFINFPKILIAIVNGPAVGIAATTLGLCDFVFACEKAFFYTPFTKLGIVAEGCSTYTFPRLVGPRKAAEMLYLNHRMSAQEAYEYGFVNYLYKPEEMQTKVWDKIQELANLPQDSISATKRLLQYNKSELLETNERELDELGKLWAVRDFASIQNAWNNKSKI